MDLTMMESGGIKYLPEAVDPNEPTPHLPASHPDYVPPRFTAKRATVDDMYGAEYGKISGDVTISGVPKGLPTETFGSSQTVVILNGPPGSGKDTLGSILKGVKGANLCSFKKPMLDIALAASGISEEEWTSRYDNRELKEQPWDKLCGMSCRDFFKLISECWVKPSFGKEQFSKLACNQVVAGLNVFTDGGFKEEFNHILEEFGRRNVLLVRLHRDGFDFSEDTREYLYPGNARQVDIYLVDGEPERAIEEILSLLQ